MTREEYDITEKEVGIKGYKKISDIGGIVTGVLVAFVLLFLIINPFVDGYYTVNIFRCASTGIPALYIHVAYKNKYLRERDFLYKYLTNLETEKADT